MADYLKYEDTSILSEGFGVIPKKVMRLEISIEAKAIYAYMCSYAGAGNSAFPGVEKMLNDLRISANRFYKYRKELCDAGLIKIEKRRKDGRRDNNIYILNQSVDLERMNQHLQNKGIEEKQHLQNECIENECIEIQCIENEGINNNSLLNNNSINNNSINKQQHKELKAKLKGFTDKEINLVLKDANYDINTVVCKYEIIKKVNGVKNIVGALRKAIKEDWQPSKKGDSPVGSFGNYKQREYDFEDLEKKLLGIK